MRKTPIAFAALAAMVVLPAAGLAHHGWGWTESDESRLSGTIREITFSNPHMHLRLQDADGELWEVDRSPPIVAQRSGFGPEVAAAGDEASLTGHRARDHSVRGFKAERIRVRDVTYDVYPQRPHSLDP